MHKAEPFLENETHKILWDFEDANKPPNPHRKTRSSDNEQKRVLVV